LFQQGNRLDARLLLTHHRAQAPTDPEHLERGGAVRNLSRGLAPPSRFPELTLEANQHQRRGPERPAQVGSQFWRSSGPGRTDQSQSRTQEDMEGGESAFFVSKRHRE